MSSRKSLQLDKTSFNGVIGSDRKRSGFSYKINGHFSLPHLAGDKTQLHGQYNKTFKDKEMAMNRGASPLVASNDVDDKRNRDI